MLAPVFKFASRFLVFATAVFISASLAAPSASAQTELWGGDFDGSWFTDANWLDGTAPLPGSDVAITAIGDDYRVDLLNSFDVDDLAISSANATLRTGSAGGLETLNATGSIDIFAGELQSFGSFNYNAANGLVNHGGVLQIFGQGSSTSVSNGIVNQANGLVRIFGQRNSQGTASFGARLHSSAGMDNFGTVHLETSRVAANTFAELSVAGTLNNSGLIDSRPFVGSGVGIKTINAATLNNSGTIVNNDSGRLSMAQSNANYSNSGIINAAVGNIQIRGVNSFVNEASGNIIGTEIDFTGINNTTTTLTNAGNINVSGNLDVDGFNLVENSGDMHAGGDFMFRFRTFDHKDGATLTGGNNMTFTNAILNMENGFTTDFAVVNLAGSTIQGSGTYISQAGTTTSIVGMTTQSGTDWENHGSMTLSGTNTISATMNGTFTNRTGGEFRIRGFRTNSGFVSAGATMNMNNGFTNEGTLSLETVHGGGPAAFARLNINGTFANSGVVDSRPFEGSNVGLRSISANIVHNSGTIVQNDTGRLDFNRSSATYTNSGNIDVLTGEVRFLSIGSFSNSGLMDVHSGAEISFTGGPVVNELGGMISGNGTVQSTATSFTDNGILSPGASPGVLTMNVNNYVQTSDGILDMEIAGLSAGSEYDQIVFSGNSATLNGTLRLSFLTGFAPSENDEFNLLLGSFATNFQSIEIAGLQDGFQYSTTNSGGLFTLLALNDGVSAVPEPSSAVLLFGSLCFMGYRRRRRIRFPAELNILCE